MAQMLFILGGDINLGLGFAVGLAKIITPTFLVDAPLLGLLGLAAVVPGNVLMAVIV
jgi:ribose transport system ATP-binding protein